MTNCTLCGGNIGQLVNGVHTLCAARHQRGMPTPCLGMRCLTCGGAKTLGKGGVCLSLSLGPAAIKRSIDAQFPPCSTCHGTGMQGPESRPSRVGQIGGHHV